MTIETIKRMLDACYQGKRIRDMLPPLPRESLPPIFNIWMSSSRWSETASM